jgi:hypothetical protein
MSEMETHVGKLRKVQRNEGQSVEDWCRERCEADGEFELHSFYNSFKEFFMDNHYDEFFSVDDEIWEISDHKELDDDDIYEMIPNPDGTVSFVMRFYNGGTCLAECIEEGLTNLDSNKTFNHESNN